MDSEGDCMRNSAERAGLGAARRRQRGTRRWGWRPWFLRRWTPERRHGRACAQRRLEWWRLARQRRPRKLLGPEWLGRSRLVSLSQLGLALSVVGMEHGMVLVPRLGMVRRRLRLFLLWGRLRRLV